MEVMIMAFKKYGAGNDRLTFPPGGCEYGTARYKDAVGNDKVADLSCTDRVKVLRTIPMQLTPEEQKIVKKNLSISDISKAYISANGHLMLVLDDGTETDAGEARGISGDTPYVGENGNWFIAGKDTGVLATGIAAMPRIGENGNWYLADFDTGVKATGDDGITPHIGENGNWYLGDVDSGVKARNVDVSLYADDLYTSGVLVTDDLESFVMTGGVREDGKPQIVTSPGVAYIKGVRRWLNTSRRTYDVRDTDRVQAQYLRLNEATGEIGLAIWHDVTISGDLDNGGEIVDEFTGEVIPKRSGGYYDVILCIATIPAGATEVTPDMIRDLRGDERYCGFVRSKVDGGGAGGLNTEAANLLIYILKRATYKEDVSGQIGRLEEILLGNSGGETDSGLTITDDGNGNVVITTYGNASITDDGNGNVTITVPDGMSITDDGNGNVIIA
jgi:hypothetical protein